ncbi:hypothetical protein OI70_18910 [Dickeya fangzhongdai]|uniref:DUF3085 domain-containing protein n=1 Tax=Dickeya fangzhongdai TaxID=1778540 RepID=UPI00057384FE|nr:DUF3085 domain-containing protein [Dickeya fangzhongdai]KHN52876.1 hypothetical protein OI70_18910 [Dickeya fangzhongdai]
MALLFKGKDLRPLLSEAIANKSRVILVKDHGVYFLAEHGERRSDGRQNLIAYAIGCNPDLDPFDDWWELALSALGGDDFAEYFDPSEGVFARILAGNDDLELSATSFQLFLQTIAPVRKNAD